ncbi:multicopper oxidase family protein [Lysobacter sp. cf310]|uniref:multicopper oxidase family protein n=1 Tax=Lysobacter sp. cf310 TaxID=1761790 RepID=UPI0008E0337D|nr:multicopper oxidase domain-containing protein [Lysobacter sp. cf310]SFK73749.1 bilirubin oxidase [Lysobacter sp. cf310]
MTDTTRRRLFVGLAATAAVVAATPWLFQRRREHDHAMNPTAPESHTGPGLPNAQPFQTPLRLPGREGLFAEVALSAPLALSARAASFPIFAGKPTPVWHYAGSVEGRAVANPLLRAAQGDRVEVALANELAEATTIHWHGLSIDEANDGSGLHPVAAGARRTYRYTIDNRAGLYWYHAHPHERTGLQLQRGLAGLLRVEDAEDRALGERLGLRWGERDLPLFIADKQVDADNAIVYRIGADDWIGNRVLVNWTPEPFLEVLPALYRLRLVNGCNARMLRIAFDHQGQTLPFRLIGTDGGLLAQAWNMDDVFLAPAQRIDVLVDFGALPAGARVLLRSLEYVAMENEDESGAFAPDPMGDHPGAAPMGDALDLMQFCVAACSDGQRRQAKVASANVPAALSALPAPPDTAGWPVRPIRLRMDSDGTWFINDWNYHQVGHAPVFNVKRGSREVWEIRNNMTSMPHPIHLHGFQFRVVSRSISPPDVRSRKVAPQGLGPQDLGLSDTVVVWPGEIVRIAIDFSQPYSGTQRYMLHCHNLEHEDMGMMVSFAVED